METPTLIPPTAPRPAETAPGAPLGIKVRRTWKTYQVVMFCTLALLIGMRIGYDGEDSPTIGPGGATNVTSGLPPDPDAASPAAGDGMTAAPGDGSEPDLEPETGTDADESSAGPIAPAGARPQVILDLSPRTGPFKSENFTLAPGIWKVGWSFNCQQHGGTGLFSVSIQRPGGEAVGQDPAIDRDGAGATGVDEFTSDGPHVVVVNTECLWRLKVTGVLA